MQCVMHDWKNPNSIHMSYFLLISAATAALLFLCIFLFIVTCLKLIEIRFLTCIIKTRQDFIFLFLMLAIWFWVESESPEPKNNYMLLIISIMGSIYIRTLKISRRHKAMCEARDISRCTKWTLKETEPFLGRNHHFLILSGCDHHPLCVVS